MAKDCSLSRLLTVIRGVLRDETHLPPALLTGVLRELTAARKHRTESERLVESLTPREREVLALIGKGYSVQQSARALTISPHTAHDHVRNIYRKLAIASRAEAAIIAREMGLN